MNVCARPQKNQKHIFESWRQKLIKVLKMENLDLLKGFFFSIGFFEVNGWLTKRKLGR